MNKMKIILIILICSISILKSFSQIDSTSTNKTSVDSLSQIVSMLEKSGLNHFKFKGIPIKGTIKEFAKKLEKQNFTIIKTTKEIAILTGKFTGEDVQILVQASSNTVYGVTVVYNEHSSWKSIKNQYQSMKSMLTTKYGQPQETVEKFESDYEDLGLELLALSQDKCTYMTHFSSKSGNGMIRLSMSSDASIVLNYADTINYLKVSNEAYDDL